MSEQAIKVIKIGKRYSIGERIQYGTLRESVISFTSNALSRFRKKPVENTGPGISPNGGTGNTQNFIWSLKDVSFEVKKGEIIGIIGNNGAGKSTLLKLISGITEPTEGRIEIYGRIGSLLEVGTGFHPELTGKENIYLNGAILGMKRREIERKFDEIVDFSGIDRFIDTPVKYYSSGMRVRLGFSVAAHLEPDILILDEVLAVGDAAFQKKCLGKIDNIASSEGRTVLFVSHDLAAIRSLCHRTILFEDGQIKADGPTSEVVDMYLRSMDSIEDLDIKERKDFDRRSDLSVIPTFLKVENLVAEKPIRPTSQIIIKLGYRSNNPVNNLNIQLKIKDSKTNQIITTLDSDGSTCFPKEIPSEGTLICITHPIYFTSGMCRIDLRLIRGSDVAFKLENAGSFSVEDEFVYGTSNTTRYYGMFLLEHEWSFASE
ncbi:MAG: polysaccharide ABC transporter ATP-binding protein [Thermodesulfobacteriota bacterium]